METQFIWQIVGFLALFFVFLAFKETNDKKLIILLAIWSGVWGIHFSLLGLIAAAGINFFDVCKNLVSLRYKNNLYLLSFFILSYMLIWGYSYLQTSSIYSFFPTIASIIGVVAVFCFSGIPLRVFMLSTLIVWFVYNIIWWSIAWMTSDIVLIWATLYGIYKLKYQKITS